MYAIRSYYEHHTHGENNGNCHDGNILHQADRCNHRVQRKHDIKDGDLHQHGPQGHRSRAVRVPGRTFQAGMDFMRGLGQQEQASYNFV